MSLRKALNACAVAVLLVAVAAAVVLVVATARLHRSATEIAVAMENAQLAAECLVDLRALPALGSRLAAAGADRGEVEGAIRERVSAIRRRLAELERRQLDGDSAAALRAARTAVERYFDEDADPSDRRWTSEGVESARAMLRSFIEANAVEAREERTKAARIDAAADLFGVAAALVLVLGTAGIVLLARERLIRPLLRIADGMSRYARGDRAARLPDVGAAELDHVCREFNHMADTLERRREDQLAFLAGVAHDLRNPISAMRLGLRTLSIERATSSPTAKLAMLDRQLDRMERLASDFLDAARIDAGQLELSFADVDLRDVVTDAATPLDGTSPAHRLRVTCGALPVTSRCDSGRIEQVVVNLVTNAIKYSPDGGTIEVTVDVDDRDALVIVADHGVGIAPDEVERIFEPFRRGTRLRHAVPGLGLGLATSRRIVERHGGRLTVTSKVGIGSRFEVRLPRSRADLSSPTEGTCPPLASTPRHGTRA